MIPALVAFLVFEVPVGGPLRRDSVCGLAFFAETSDILVVALRDELSVDAPPGTVIEVVARDGKVECADAAYGVAVTPGLVRMRVGARHHLTRGTARIRLERRFDIGMEIERPDFANLAAIRKAFGTAAPVLPIDGAEGRVCSGSAVVDPEGQVWLMTAAHCLLDPRTRRPRADLRTEHGRLRLDGAFAGPDFLACFRHGAPFARCVLAGDDIALVPFPGARGPRPSRLCSNQDSELVAFGFGLQGGVLRAETAAGRFVVERAEGRLTWARSAIRAQVAPGDSGGPVVDAANRGCVSFVVSGLAQGKGREVHALLVESRLTDDLAPLR